MSYSREKKHTPFITTHRCVIAFLKRLASPATRREGMTVSAGGARTGASRRSSRSWEWTGDWRSFIIKLYIMCIYIYYVCVYIYILCMYIYIM